MSNNSFTLIFVLYYGDMRMVSDFYLTVLYRSQLLLHLGEKMYRPPSQYTASVTHFENNTEY